MVRRWGERVRRAVAKAFPRVQPSAGLRLARQVIAITLGFAGTAALVAVLLLGRPASAPAPNPTTASASSTTGRPTGAAPSAPAARTSGAASSAATNPRPGVGSVGDVTGARRPATTADAPADTTVPNAPPTPTQALAHAIAQARDLTATAAAAPASAGADSPATTAPTPAGAAAAGQGYGSTGPTPAGQEPSSGAATAAAVLQPPVDGAVVVPFGWAYSETLAAWRLHPGLSLSAPAGAPVRAAAPGTVTAVRDDALWGWTVVINDGGGVLTEYASLSAAAVRAGERVAADATIGHVGDSAAIESALGDHLFFEVVVNGHAVDPLPLIQRAPSD